MASWLDGDEKGIIEEWSKRFAGLTGEQIKHGLEKWDKDWPPSADEFKKICLDKQNEVNEYGLINEIPIYYREPIRDKSKLLSNFDRDKQREVYSRRIKETLNKLKGGYDND